MATEAALGLISAMGTRYLVSQGCGVSFGTGLVYNVFDSGVSLLVCKYLGTISTKTPGTQDVLGVILISRILGIVAGKVASAPFGNVSLSTAIVLNTASLVAGVFIRILVGNMVRNQPVAETNTPEGTPDDLSGAQTNHPLYTSFILLTQEGGKIVQELMYA